MSAELNTARALLKAGNFDGARRIVRKALEENPENLWAWNLRIDIEMEAGQYKEALVLARQVLANHPDNVYVREIEFYAIGRLRKKREAKRIFERFSEDFPHQTGRIKTMRMALNSLSERLNKVSQTLREYGETATDPQSVKELGLAHHRINDLWTAQRLLLEAHPHFPNDAELNAALATNYFQLARPATARKYARLALATNPAERRMALLMKASWLQYWPPFFFITVLFMIYYAIGSLFGKIASNIAIIVIIFTTGKLFDVWYDILNVMTEINIASYKIIPFLAWIALYTVCMAPDFYSKLFGKKKPVKLKKF